MRSIDFNIPKQFLWSTDQGILESLTPTFRDIINCTNKGYYRNLSILPTFHNHFSMLWNYHFLVCCTIQNCTSASKGNTLMLYCFIYLTHTSKCTQMYSQIPPINVYGTYNWSHLLTISTSWVFTVVWLLECYLFGTV